MSDNRIVITRPLPGDAVGMLREAGFMNVWIYDRDEKIPRRLLLDVVKGAGAVIANPGDADLGAKFFDAAGDQLAIVSNFAVGVDNIDVEEAKRRGIVVGHTPGAVTEPTADITWLLLLGASRRAHEGERLARSGKWTGIGPNDMLGHRVVGRTLFIIGAGRIGQAVARRSIGWSMTVLYHDQSPQQSIEMQPINAKQIPLDEGLTEADFVSLHTPYTPQTHHIIGADHLALMKRNSILINTSRGKCVDEAALVEALKNGRIAAAGLDVYENEPQLHPELAGLDNTFLMPHVGSATHDDRRWMVQIAVDNVIAVLNGEIPPHTVT